MNKKLNINWLIPQDKTLIILKRESSCFGDKSFND